MDTRESVVEIIPARAHPLMGRDKQIADVALLHALRTRLAATAARRCGRSDASAASALDCYASKAGCGCRKLSPQVQKCGIGAVYCERVAATVLDADAKARAGDQKVNGSTRSGNYLLGS